MASNPPRRGTAQRRPGFSLRHLPADTKRDLTTDDADHADATNAPLPQRPKPGTQPYTCPAAPAGLIEPIIERTLCKNGIDVQVLCYNCLDGDARTND
jgi:hypothetical protein